MWGAFLTTHSPQWQVITTACYHISIDLVVSLRAQRVFSHSLFVSPFNTIGKKLDYVGSGCINEFDFLYRQSRAHTNSGLEPSICYHNKICAKVSLKDRFETTENGQHVSITNWTKRWNSTKKSEWICNLIQTLCSSTWLVSCMMIGSLEIFHPLLEGSIFEALFIVKMSFSLQAIARTQILY